MNKVVKRGTVEIFYEILSTCRKPVNKTRIIYHCNINFVMFQKYLDIMTTSGLIKISNDETRELFMTTDKGKNFIEYYKNMMSLMTNKQSEIMALVND